MLSDRIISTIKFFDLQDYPLTAFEVWRYLISEKSSLKEQLDENFELKDGVDEFKSVPVHFDTVLGQLDSLVEGGDLVEVNGFYTFPKRKSIIGTRLVNYRYGIPRERKIKRFLPFTKHLPFVRGISLAGSQAMGLQRSTSDIDLLIITDPRFIWLGRTFLTAYFQIFGIRRHGKKITNRFCLNHYVAQPREVDVEKNLYKAMEYCKLRPVVYGEVTTKFQEAHKNWIKLFFPNITFDSLGVDSVSFAQKFIEKLFDNRFGLWLEKKLGQWQLGRIKQDKYVFVKEDELSFHPDSKQETLLKAFFN